MPAALVGANIALLTAIALLVGYLVTPHGGGSGGGSPVDAAPVSLQSEVQAVASATASADSLVKSAAGSGSAGASFTSTTTEKTAATTSTAPRTAALPFDMPSTATLRGSGHKVFAHYMPTLPISIDNRPAASDYYTTKYIAPLGEGGKFKASGGFLRDRPLPRGPVGGDYKLADMRTEVAQATSAGLDGFALDLLSISPSAPAWSGATRMMQAADGTGFKILITPDMPALHAPSVAALADATARLAAHNSAYRLGDGRLAVSPFQADLVSVDYWKSYISTMKSQHGISVALVPVFLNEMTSGPKYASVTYGQGNWGFRYPTGNVLSRTDSGSARGRAIMAMKGGKLWFQPVSAQDERPVKGVFEESGNTQNIRYSWQVAIATKADWVNMATWNDYSEGSQIAPSLKRNWVNLDLSSYYLAQYKTGVAPTIVRDTVYVSHRTQPYDAKPSFPQSVTMKLARGMAPINTVEAVGFLTKPGTITVSAGGRTASCAVPAGVQTCTVPLAAGTVTARITRGSAVATSVTSPWKITNSPTVQDLQYVSASSGRTESGAVARTSTAAPAATTSTTTTTTTTKAAATPKAAGSASPVKPAIASPAVTGVKSAPNSVPVADTTPRQLTALKANGSPSALAARGGRGSYTSFLRFNVPKTPAGKKLATASLRIHTTTAPDAGSASDQSVYLAGNAWQESGRKPKVSTDRLGRLRGTKVADHTYTVKLDAAQLAKFAGTQQTVAVTNRTSDTLWFWSRHSPTPDTSPTLLLTYK